MPAHTCPRRCPYGLPVSAACGGVGSGLWGLGGPVGRFSIGPVINLRDRMARSSGWYGRAGNTGRKKFSYSSHLNSISSLICSDPQSQSWSRIGIRDWPRSVIEYSTFGGICG